MPEQDESAQGSADSVETKLVNFEVTIEPPANYVYSNVSSVAISPWDLRINFADINVTKEGEQSFPAVIGVVLPPEHAAGLAMLITRQLKQYEDQFGEIRQPQWQAMKAGAKRKAKGLPES